MGELVGKLYIDNYFKSDSKEKANELFIYIKNELEHYLKTNDWMEPQTKIKALDKLNKMNIKIGYPEKLEYDWELLKILDSNSFLENIILLKKFNNQMVLKKLYEKLNRDTWAMPAHVINAYYSPTLNEIVFPAGILQKPFFSVDQEPALNFGGIGMVIGHEITHGFDDQGSKYDSDGNLNNWWTPSDYEKYKNKTNIIKEQYNQYEIDGNKVNGQLTLGENIADIGGLALSYKAFIKYINRNQTKSKTDSKYQILYTQNDYDYTPKQKFFLNYANIWKMKSTKEDALNRLVIDPHAPPIYRVNGVVRNLDDFYEAFNINPSNQLYLNPELRAKIWS
jgi:putative endopeptidase